jgi:hypothetical protein
MPKQQTVADCLRPTDQRVAESFAWTGDLDIAPSAARLQGSPFLPMPS